MKAGGRCRLHCCIGPIILAYIDLTNPLSAMCPWCITNHLNHMHHHWNCTGTHVFWDQVLGYAQKVTSTRLPADPLLCLFSYVLHRDQSSSSEIQIFPQWVHLCLLTAHRAILKAWTSSSRPFSLYCDM